MIERGEGILREIDEESKRQQKWFEMLAVLKEKNYKLNKRPLNKSTQTL